MLEIIDNILVSRWSLDNRYYHSKDQGGNLQIIHKYRIRSVLKVETDIITYIAVSCIVKAAILVIM